MSTVDQLAQSLRFIVERLEIAHKHEGITVCAALMPDARAALSLYDRTRPFDMGGFDITDASPSA